MSEKVKLSELAFRDGIDATLTVRPLRLAMRGLFSNARGEKIDKSMINGKKKLVEKQDGSVHWDVKKAS